MESLKDLLLEKNLDEPSEVTALRDYYQALFKKKPSVKITANAIVLTVPNGKIATEMRARQLDIEMRCQLTKKFIVRIG